MGQLQKSSIPILSAVTLSDQALSVLAQVKGLEIVPTCGRVERIRIGGVSVLRKFGLHQYNSDLSYKKDLD